MYLDLQLALSSLLLTFGSSTVSLQWPVFSPDSFVGGIYFSGAIPTVYFVSKMSSWRCSWRIRHSTWKLGRGGGQATRHWTQEYFLGLWRSVEIGGPGRGCREQGFWRPKSRERVVSGAKHSAWTFSDLHVSITRDVALVKVWKEPWGPIGLLCC